MLPLAAGAYGLLIVYGAWSGIRLAAIKPAHWSTTALRRSLMVAMLGCTVLGWHTYNLMLMIFGASIALCYATEYHSEVSAVDGHDEPQALGEQSRETY
jgi:hypothetical protein